MVANISFNKLSHDFGDQSLQANDAGAFRTYCRGDTAYPSVTSVLTGTSDHSGIDAWKARVGEEEANRISKASTTIGTAMHLLCEHYVDGVPSETSIFKAKQMFEQIKKKLDKGLTAYYGQEIALFSHKYRLAGRTDLIGQWHGVDSIIDYKSNHGDKVKEDKYISDYKIQLAAYALMAEDYGLHINQGVLLIATVFGCQVVVVDLTEWKKEFKERRVMFYNLYKI
jgi:hypothetical protein